MPPVTETIQERRLFERFSARFPAKFKDSRNDYGTDVFLRDASASGVRVVTKDRFFLEDSLSLEVELPDGAKPLMLEGKVVWTKLLKMSLWDVGLQFPKVDFIKTRRIFKLTEKLAS